MAERESCVRAGSVLRLALGIAGAVAAWTGGGASAQTLTEALSYAYNNNPQLLAQRALLRATDEQVPQALSGWRPTVNFTGSGGFERGALSQNNGPAVFSNFVQRELDLKVTQPVYNGGRTEAQTRQAINTVEAARAQTLATETTVFQAVCQAFLDVVRDQTLVEVNRNNEAVLKKQLDATRDRFKVGEVTRTDVAQAESSYSQAVATRIASEGQLEVSRAAYTRSVGHPPGRLVMPKERPALPATRDEALNIAATDNFNVIAANFTELAAKDNVDAVRGQLLPQVSIVGDLNRTFAPSITLNVAREDTASVVGAGYGAAVRGRADLFADPRGAAAGRGTPQPDRRRKAPGGAGREPGVGHADLGACVDRVVFGCRAGGADRAGRDPAGGAGRFAHGARRADFRAAALHHRAAARPGRARRRARRV